MNIVVNLTAAKQELANILFLRKQLDGYTVVVVGNVAENTMVYYDNPEEATCNPLAVIGMTPNRKYFVTIKHPLHRGQITFITCPHFIHIESIISNEVDFLKWSPHFDPAMDMVILPDHSKLIPETDEYDQQLISSVLYNFTSIYEPTVRIADDTKADIINAARLPYPVAVQYI